MRLKTKQNRAISNSRRYKRTKLEIVNWYKYMIIIITL